MKEVGLKTHAGPSNGWSWSVHCDHMV